MRFPLFVTTASVLAIALLAGCSGGASSTPAIGAPAEPQSIAFNDDGFVDSASATTSAIGINLSGEKSGNSKPYGKLLGYFPGTKIKTSQVVTLHSGQTVVFHNLDSSLTHTASLLGDASKSHAPWPTSFDGSEAQSPAKTDISTTDFSTGPLSPHKNSLKYTANVPGFYMFGCFFHYTFGMRDIIIVE
jgi:plastocyanin